jgi:hypothetical protein
VECHRSEAPLFLSVVESGTRGWPVQQFTGLALRVKPEEMIYCAFPASLVEPRPQAGHYVGGYQSVSFHVPGTKSMRYRVGGSRGTYVQGAEVPTPVDYSGTIIITTKRAVYAGMTRSREWAWDQLLGYEQDVADRFIAIQVSNRQETSGFGYAPGMALDATFWMGFALAQPAELAQMATDLSELIASHGNDRPALPTGSA